MNTEGRTIEPLPETAGMASSRRDRRDQRIAVGIFWFVLAVYVLTSPGRIDYIDGQTRYDVAVHWLVEGRPVLGDQNMARMQGLRGPDGRMYTSYGPAATVLGMPLIAAGFMAGHGSVETARFMFSLTSAFLGAGTAVVLFLFYRELGLTFAAAIGWTAANAFATMLWPAATSTLDNAQHALFAVWGLFLAFISGRRNSNKLAVAGGVAAGALLLYQDYFVLIIPAIAIPVIGSRQDWRRSVARLAAFAMGTMVDVVLVLAYNYFRFGSPFSNGRSAVAAAIYRGDQAATALYLGNPLAGALTLLVSPGKSIFLYSPLILVAILGLRRLWREYPRLAQAIVLASIALIAFLANIRFASGDWCWGPRYLTVLLPLWAIAMPYAPVRKNGTRTVAYSMVGLSLAVQLMSLSVEHQRFFFEHNLRDFFWADDSWFYFKNSALAAWPREMWSVLHGPPATVRSFHRITEPGYLTYTTMGPSPDMEHHRDEWMKQYAIFYLPRPWVFWMLWVPPGQRPISVPLEAGGVMAVGVFGLIRIRREFSTP